MHSLRSLIEILKPAELSFLKQLYSSQKEAEGKEKLEWLNKIISKEECSIPASIKSKMRTDLINVLVFKNKNHSKKCAPNKARMFCITNIIGANILLERGEGSQALELLCKAEEEALRYELLDLYFVIGSMLVEIYQILEQPEEMRQRASELTKSAEFLSQHAKLSGGELSEASLNSELNTIEHKKFLFHTNQKINDNDLDSSLNMVKGLKAQLANNHVLKSRINMAQLSILQAKIFLKAGNIEGCKSEIQNAESFNVEHLKITLPLLDLKIRVNLFSNCLEQAEEALLKFGDLIKPLPSINLKAKFQLYHSTLLFLQGHFCRARRALLETRISGKSSEHLRAYYLLEIMCYIEEDEKRLVAYKIETFRKLLMRHRSFNVSREINILRVLGAVARNELSFAAAKTKVEPLLESLRDKDLKWDPLGSFLIQFEKWFENKVEQESNSLRGNRTR